MGIHNFNTGQEFVSIDKIPDHRSDDEKLFSPLAVYNHDSPDIAYAERLAEELVNLSGAWVTIFPRTQNHGIVDEVWDEDRDPTYKSGIKFKGQFAPAAPDIELLKWGVDIANKCTISFSRAAIFKQFGKRMLTVGDIIELPHNTLSPLQTSTPYESSDMLNRYRILNAADDGNFKYRWLYWKCICENITGDSTIDVEHR
jgi:hypothetical protein